MSGTKDAGKIILKIKRMNAQQLKPLVDFLEKVPGVRVLNFGTEDEFWWVKLAIDIEHPLAWSVVQEFGHVLNYISTEERLPTLFYPVSPPPYLNGGPAEFLSWIIENTDVSFTPSLAKEWLEGRLPSPVDVLSAWEV